jgi:hypothetical protein
LGFNFLLPFFLVVGVALDVQLNELSNLLHFCLEGILPGNHFFLGVSRSDFPLFDLLLSIEDLVECLLFVTENFTFGDKENIVCGGVVEGEFFGLLCTILFAKRSISYCKWQFR